MYLDPFCVITHCKKNNFYIFAIKFFSVDIKSFIEVMMGYISWIGRRHFQKSQEISSSTVDTDEQYIRWNFALNFSFEILDMLNQTVMEYKMIF